MKKLTYEHVKSFIESFNYKLLSEEYKNNYTKLKMVCPERHVFEMPYASFKLGCRCPNCSGNQKHPYDYIKQKFESFNYQLLSKKYESAHKKLKMKCPFGHIIFMTWANFSQGCRCNECAGNQTLTIEYIKETIKDFAPNYTLLTGKYINANTKMFWKCPKGHIFERNWNKFYWRNQKCNICATKQYNLSYENVKEYIKSFGYKLLSDEYINNQTKLMIQCPKNHKFEMAYNSFQRGSRCPDCYKEIQAKNLSLDYKDVRFYIESFNYKLLSDEYKNSITKLMIQCPKGHVYWVTYGNFQSGKRCPKCYAESTSSKQEREIQEFIPLIYNEKIINNDRNTILNPLTGYYLELDVYLPDINKAIEFNGTYWHSEAKLNTVKRDKIKKEQCDKLGIDLLIIEEQMWNYDKSHCLNLIENFIGI